MNTITKQVFLNEILYRIEIEEIDQGHFWSQQIAVAKAYANVHNVWYYPLLERLASLQSVEHQNDTDKELLKLWHMAFR